MILKSPAKLNLFFRVLKKRTDGYHDIASLYQAISLCDTLKISKSGEDRLLCNHPQIPFDQTNLIIRAAHLFRQKTKLPQNFTFELDKQIPIQAGLGGGSSNAATALWGMNQITGLNVDLNTLAQWGSELGSDVPFFFSGGTAYCEGRGEKMTPLAPLHYPSKIWIAKPQEGLSTPQVYQNVKVDFLQKRDPKKALESCLAKHPLYFNDLEISAFALLPKLASLKTDLMKLGFQSVTMTGSGTAFFCIGEVEFPQLPDIAFYSVKSIHCDGGKNWYS